MLNGRLHYLQMEATLISPYTPPHDLWEVNCTLQLNEPLDGSNDPRWVDTGKARGEYSLRSLYRALGVEDGEGESPRRLRTPPDRGYYLFCGHRGCSTRMSCYTWPPR